MTRLAAPRRRLGFTLIELLVVLLIIGILIGLLFPAIAAAVRRARSAAVQAEINQLAQALADWKSQKGDYPPSRIVIREDGLAPSGALNSVANDITTAQLSLRTTIAFRKFWPRVVMPNPNNTTQSYYDFNGNGNFDVGTQFLLQGQECLVFFLGGIATPSFDLSGNVIGIAGMSGFGKSPTNPFTNNLPNVPTNTMYNPNRNPPLFEFSGGRLAINTNLAPGMAYYLDSINASTSQNQGPVGFYSYFSTNNGSGYDPNDVNLTETDSQGNSPLAVNFQTSVGITPSLSPNPYTSSYPSGSASVQYLAPQSFQIISSGVDAVFGVGGYYNPNATSDSALADETSISPNSPIPLDRTIERDNLTNFRNGTLE